MAEDPDIKLLDGFVATHGGPVLEGAWRRVRASLVKAKRISSDSLPRVSSAAQNFVASRDNLSAGIRGLPPGGDPDRFFESALRYLTAGIDSLARSFAATKREDPTDSIPPPNLKKS